MLLGYWALSNCNSQQQIAFFLSISLLGHTQFWFLGSIPNLWPIFIFNCTQNDAPCSHAVIDIKIPELENILFFLLLKEKKCYHHGQDLLWSVPWWELSRQENVTKLSHVSHEKSQQYWDYVKNSMMGMKPLHMQLQTLCHTIRQRVMVFFMIMLILIFWWPLSMTKIP